ncbi:MAG: class I SAM-dependent methyltransferase [Polyangiaceae bacterium]|nr:class I SAM-dependent methyltransferase [Polyangiaceae bacterium]MCE7891636.1 methyltransferase [Sorangiineae bacterium PRO1]MCL4751458.1 methyltransferase [Myxococcales bacterium]
MSKSILVSAGCVLFAACGPAKEPSVAPIEPVVAPTAQNEELAADKPAPEPSAEEKKKAEEKQKLEADREKMLADHKAELARWTPELTAEARALAEKSYPTGKAAILAALAGKHRRPESAARDRHRHPLETLEFMGFAPTMTVLEYGPGEGWYTELLAPALAKRGKLVITNGDPKGPPDLRATFYAERVQLFLDKSPELFGKVERVTVDGKNPKLPQEGTLDLALVIRGMHGMQNNGTLDAWLAELRRALKPKGVLGVVQHRAAPDADPAVSSKQGYLPEKWLIERIEAAGFKLQKKSEINANPKDTRDHPDGVWSLPPTLRGGDKDREKFVAIGESDRMTLRFGKKE